MSGELLFNLPREKYDRISRVHWSTLKLLGKSPAHYLAAITEGTKDSAPKKVGRGTHLAVIEPERFRSECVLWDGGRRASKKWDAFVTEHAHREILTETEWAQCMSLQRAVRGNKVASKYLEGGKGEVSVLWEHSSLPIGGIPGFTVELKGRLDFISNAGVLVDLKTTRDASPEGFGRECFKYRYHTQAALYRDGYFAATGEWLPYYLVAAETTAPFVVQVYRVPERLLAIGREEYVNLLSRLELCRSESHWPGYFDGEGELELPRWATFDHEEEDLTGIGLEFSTQESSDAL